jgi:radical SAM protein with 4Fe4S-binding SPASM domain
MGNFSWLSKDQNVDEVRNSLKAFVQSNVAAHRPSLDEIKTIYLFLTRKCNLSCQHCYIEGVGPQAVGIDFDLKTITGLVAQALPLGLAKVKVSGGEPMVHREFLEIMEFLGTCGLKEIVLETNATLLDNRTIEHLSKIPQLTIFVSLDHVDSAAHDSFRSKTGAFARTSDALQHLGRTAISSVVTTTANRSNYRSIPAIIDLVLGWGIKRHRTLLNIHPLGNARSMPENAVALDECEALIETVLSSPHFKRGRAYMTLPPALMPLENVGDAHACGWGESVLGILSNGEVSMCSASYDDREMIAGNALETPLLDIWRRSPLFARLRQVAAGDVKGVCGNCVFYSVCHGVCKMSSWAHYGEKDAPYPLCQEAYNAGKFPAYALLDPQKDCRYSPSQIARTRAMQTSARRYDFLGTDSSHQG